MARAEKICMSFYLIIMYSDEDLMLLGDALTRSEKWCDIFNEKWEVALEDNDGSMIDGYIGLLKVFYDMGFRYVMRKDGNVTRAVIIDRMVDPIITDFLLS